jgi:hypothetical protein
MAYADLAAALQGDVPSLSYLLALQHIKRAYRDILDAREWSFLAAEESYVCPPQLTTGTVAITQGSLDVTPDADVLAAVAASWPLSVPLTGAQVRWADSGLYTLIQTATVPWQVDRPVAEATALTSAYQLYQAYLTAPTDFKRWDAVVDIPNGLTIDGENLTYSQAEVDARDPQRQSLGQASSLAWVTPDPVSGLQRYELWPHPTSGQTFLAHYRAKGVGFAVKTDTQPPIIPDGLILQRAYGWNTYPWAAANSVRLPSLGGAKVPWMNLILEAKAAYKVLFATAVRDDEATAPQRIWSRGSGIRAGNTLMGRIGDAAYWQRHGVNW